MRIAVVGDLHGCWVAFRDVIRRIQAEGPLDLVLQVGDAQPISSDEDLRYLPVPDRYLHHGDFTQVMDEPWPVPTLFVGGNHEPFNVLAPLPHGGDLIPNLSYLGRWGHRAYGNLRLGGLSGVHSPRAYDRPPLPWPFTPEHKKDASYYRRQDVEGLGASGQVDIFLIHEWPPQMEAAREATWPRHWASVGAAPLGGLVSTLRPRFVFCGHMHHRAECVIGATRIVALDDFSRRPLQSVALLEGPSDDVNTLELVDPQRLARILQ